MLDHLGLRTSAELIQYAIASGLVQVEFDAESAPAGLPSDVGLGLYRIVQESINNVVGHSGAASARVRVWGSPGLVGLEVLDRGRGFDPDAQQGRGLGLLSIRERVRLLHGTITMTSRPGQGTRIDVTVPLSSSDSALPS